MTLTLTKAQYSAVCDLRGLPQGAHFLIMTSTIAPGGGGVLEGSEEDFEALLSHINEDISEGLVKARALRSLVSVCEMINPDSINWLGV